MKQIETSVGRVLCSCILILNVSGVFFKCTCCRDKKWYQN